MSFNYQCNEPISKVPDELKSSCSRTIFDVYDNYNKSKKSRVPYSLDVCCPLKQGIYSATRTLVGNEFSPRPEMLRLPLRQFNSEYYNIEYNFKTNCQICFL